MIGRSKVKFILIVVILLLLKMNLKMKNRHFLFFNFSFIFAYCHLFFIFCLFLFFYFIQFYTHQFLFRLHQVWSIRKSLLQNTRFKRKDMALQIVLPECMWWYWLFLWQDVTVIVFSKFLITVLLFLDILEKFIVQ